MKTLEKELYWKTTQWLHKLWACAKSIIQHPNENLGKMISAGEHKPGLWIVEDRVLVAILKGNTLQLWFHVFLLWNIIHCVSA